MSDSDEGFQWTVPDIDPSLGSYLVLLPVPTNVL